MPPTPLPLPPDYEERAVLAQRRGVRVVRAQWRGADVVVRLEEGLSETRAELSTLATLDVEGFAQLLDYGPLEAGGRFTTAAWIEGEPLASLAGQRTPKELGRIVARLALTVAELHKAGFVHGDIKADNVIVTAGDVPVLVDFGLAGETGRQRATGGSYFHLAPELLLGHPLDPRSDVFALGVTLASLLTTFENDARAFHGRFPSEPFLTAAGVDPGSFPEWSRELIATATDRIPGRRPSDAEGFGHTLGARVGGLRTRRLSPPRLRWPALGPRREFAHARAAHLLDGEHNLEVWTFGDAAEAARVGQAAALSLSLDGHPARGVDFLQGQECSDGLALDAFVRERASGHGLSIGWGFRGALGVRLIQTLKGVAAQRKLAGWILCVTEDTPLPEGLSPRRFPALDEQAIATQLRTWLPGSNEDSIAHLAERLHAESGGSSALAEDLLTSVALEGWIQRTRSGIQLRDGQLPAHLGKTRRRDARAMDSLSSSAVQALAGLLTRGRSVTRTDLREVTGLDTNTCAGAISELIEGQWCLADGSEIMALAPLPDRGELRLDRERWEALHDSWAGRTGEDLHRWLAGDEGAAEELRQQVVARRDRGLPEGSLALLDRVRAAWRSARDEPPVWVDGESLLAWARMGDATQMDRLARRLEADRSPEARGYALRGRAREAALRHDHARADELYREAAAVDPEARSEALVARARLMFDANRHEALAALCGEVAEEERGAAVNLESMLAMSQLRRGEVEEARKGLDATLQAAVTLGELSHVPPIQLNRAILARRTGEHAQALELANEALQGYEQRGDLEGVARVQLLIGGVLREAGRLIRSQEVLVECSAIRERLGDRVGSARARGVLGLALAERGHCRAALEAIQEAANTLDHAGAAKEAQRLLSHAALMRARVGQEVHLDGLEGPAASRVAWMQGNPELARSLVAEDPTPEAQWIRDFMETGGQGDALIEGLASGATASRMIALARREEAAGRDDRAARAALASAARSDDEEALRAALRVARSCKDRATAGCTAEEALAWGVNLLGAPDPVPNELSLWESDQDEEVEMDMYRLLEINQRLVDQEDLPTLLGEIVEAALEVTEAERGFLALEEAGELHLDLALDSIRGDLDPEEVEVSQTVLREALDGGKTLRVSNAAADPVLSAAPSVTELELRSILCCPFPVTEQVRGVVYLDHRVRENAFDQRAERLLTLLAGQAALAIRQRRRLEEIETLNEELGREVASRESDLHAARRVLVQSGLTVPVDGLVGESEPMRQVHELLRRVAGADLPVLVCGETGTGKELAARAVHQLSKRREAPFITENCAALPATIVESELFGHAKGAFTGADTDRPGLFERADGGTLFLDEVGELPLDLQAKLLRVLETRELRRLGSEELLRVDFRLVAATNRELAVEVEEGRFRSDLLYRLDAIRIDLPALADRLDDLPLLVEHFLRLQRAKDGIRRAVSPNVLGALSAREWPGNVRELSNEIARLCVLSEGDLEDASLVREPQIESRLRGTGQRPLRTLADIEKEAILDAVERCDGSKKRAAEMLGISRAKVFQRWKEWHEESE